MKALYTLAFIALAQTAFSQRDPFADVIEPDSIVIPPSPKWGKLVVGGYLDTYYGYNFNQPADKNVPYFVSSARHNEFAVNLTYLELKYTHDRIRARILAGFGSYVNANNNGEPISLKNLIETSAGFRPFGKKNIWIEGGVFMSPYASESPISKDQLMYTRSMTVEFVPYFITGMRLTLPLHAKWTAFLYFINGWQVIIDNNKHKSFGSQLEYRPNDKNSFYWTTYLGDERSDAQPLNRMRYYNDIYWIHNPEGKFSAGACAYIGVQRRVDTLATRQSTHIWTSANFTARYRFSKWVSLSGRAEYFYDPDQVQITPVSGINAGFHGLGGGLCLNIHLFDHALFRIEGRGMYGFDKVYLDKDNLPVNWSAWATASLTVWFETH